MSSEGDEGKNPEVDKRKGEPVENEPSAKKAKEETLIKLRGELLQLQTGIDPSLISFFTDEAQLRKMIQAGKVAKQANPPDVLEDEKGLKGKLLTYGPPAYEVKFLEKYSDRASTFEQSGTRGGQDHPRPAQFRAFLGPSGCGKTFSAIKKGFDGFTSDDGCQLSCTLYMTATALYVGNDSIEFIDAVDAAWVRVFQEHTKKERLEMVVHVVIDEAGFWEYRSNKFSWTPDDFTRLQHRLQQHAKKVIISIAGTNLDKVLYDVTSGGPSLAKFRAKAWQPTNVLALVPQICDAYNIKIKLGDDYATNLVKKWTTDVPVFEALTGNGRAAVELVKVLLKMEALSRDPMDNIAEVVDSVSKFYINGNALAALEKRDRRKVVKAVLKVLQAPDKEPAPVVFAIEKHLEKHCHGLVDSNMEKIDDSVLYLDNTWKCPCKVSPCLTIVMFDLLGFASKLSTNWEGFENVCTLALIQAAVMETDDEFRLIQMKNAFPAPNAKCDARVPRIRRHDVVLNGPRAPHGDAFGRNKIVQSKHTSDGTKVQCDLIDELRKCGLARNDDGPGASVHAAVTALLHQQWNKEEQAENYQEKSKKDSENLSAGATRRSVFYPASLLNTREVLNYETIRIQKVRSQPVAEGEESIAEAADDDGEEWRDGSGQLIELPTSFDPAITFAICTNANSIELGLELDEYVHSQGTASTDATIEPQSKFTITQDQVDMHGKLLENEDTDTTRLITSISQAAKEGVLVRFHFC